MHRGGGGGRLPRIPPPRWSHHHPYRGGGPGSRVGPTGFTRNFHGHGRDNGDVGNNVKLFVGSVPTNATEDDIRPLFEEHGDIIEVVFIKDHRTGQQQSCCFVKYATLESAEKAIAILDNQIILPGGPGPIQVRLADGERARIANCPPDQSNSLEMKEDTPTPTRQHPNISKPTTCPHPNSGASNCKLYVGSLSRQATKKEIEEIFSPFGRVEDVLILRDEMKQSRGCCFVELANREMSEAAIKELHGTYVMSDYVHPLIVRFAIPKKPKPGEFRGGPTFGDPGFHPLSQAPLGIRATPVYTEQLDMHSWHNSSLTFSPQSAEPTVQINNIGVPMNPSNSTCSIHAATQAPYQQAQKLGPIQTPPTNLQSSIMQIIPTDSIRVEPSMEQKDASITSNQLQQFPLSSSSQQQSQHSSFLQSASRPLDATDSAMSSIISAFHIPCKWSEHLCPDGFKYYYNCITCESKWEKPEEYEEFEQRKQEKLQEQQKSCNVKHPSSPSQNHLGA